MSTTTPDPVTIDYGCPAWCERTDHDVDALIPGEAPIHYGPDFGLVGVQSFRGQLEAIVPDDDGRSIGDSPAGLRQFAADIVRAAEWLEAHQTGTATATAAPRRDQVGASYAQVLVEALREHLTARPVSMTDLGALCNVLGIPASEIARRAEANQ